MSWRKILFILITSLIVYLSFILFIGFYEFKESILQIPLTWWIASISFPFISHFILSIRWFYFIKYLKYKLNYFQSSKIYLAGLSLIAAPARSGEALRSLWLLKRFNFPIYVGISATISERIGDLLSALFLISLSLGSIKFFCFIILFILFSFYFNKFIKSAIISMLIYILQLFPFAKTYFNHKKLIENLAITFERVRNMSKLEPLLISILLCTLTWIVESILLYITFYYLKESISFQQATLIRTSMGLGGVISFLPAGLLTSESTSIALAIAFGTGQAEAIAATLFIRVYTLFIPSLMGMAAILLEKDLIIASNESNRNQS